MWFKSAHVHLLPYTFTSRDSYVGTDSMSILVGDDRSAVVSAEVKWECCAGFYVFC